MVRFLRSITANWKLKALAFALAVLVWMVITADQPTSGWFTVPLEVAVTDPNYRLEGGDVPEEVEVRFTGPGRDLFDLALRRPVFRLTVNDVEEEVEARALDPRMVQLSGQMSVNPVDVRPSAIQLQFTRIVSRTVPVQPQVAAELGEEWAIVDTLETDPATVRVTGPVRQIEEIETVPTLPFTLTSADTVIDDLVALDTASLPGIQLSTRSVRVTGRVDRVVQRTIEGVRVDVGPGIGILPQVVNVTLRGPAATVRDLSPQLFRVVISIDEIPPRIPQGGVLVPLRIDGLRPGVAATLNPAQVRLFPQTVGADTIAVQQTLPGQDSQIITAPVQ